MDDLQEYPRAHLGRFDNDNDDCGCMRACYFVTLKRIGLNSYSECTFEETHWVATETLWFVESTHPSTHPSIPGVQQCANCYCSLVAALDEIIVLISLVRPTPLKKVFVIVA